MINKSVFLFSLTLLLGSLYSMDSAGAGAAGAGSASSAAATSSSAEQHASQVTCCICIDAIDQSLPAHHPQAGVSSQKIFGCQHQFHAQCLAGWLDKATHQTCPLCRKVIQKPVPLPIHPLLDASLTDPTEDLLFVTNQLLKEIQETADRFRIHEDMQNAVKLEELQTIRIWIQAHIHGTDGTHRLLEMALHDHPLNSALIQWLIAHNATVRINNEDPDMHRWLHKIIWEEKFDIALWLIEHGADININDSALLKEAVTLKNANIAEWLINHEARPIASTWLLTLVLENRKSELASEIVKCGLDVNTALQENLEMALHLPSWNRYELGKIIYTIEWLIDHGATASGLKGSDDVSILLYRTIKDEYLNFAQWLINHGADANRCLQYALHDENFKMAQWLVNHGACPVANTWFLRHTLVQKDIHVAQRLVECGTSVNLENGLLLEEALENKQYDIALWLVDHGADVDIDDGRLLRKALQTNNVDNIKWLVEHGANIHAHDEEAIRYAPTAEIEDYLCAHGDWRTRIARHLTAIVSSAIVATAGIGVSWWLHHHSHHTH